MTHVHISGGVFMVVHLVVIVSSIASRILDTLISGGTVHGPPNFRNSSPCSSFDAFLSCTGCRCFLETASLMFGFIHNSLLVLGEVVRLVSPALGGLG